MARRLSRVWGSGVLVVDTSAWSRAHRPEVRDAWVDALLGDRVRLSPVVKLEILLSARNGDGFDGAQKELDALRTAPLSSPVVRSAEVSMRALAHRSAGAHRIPVVDYLVGRSAEPAPAPAPAPAPGGAKPRSAGAPVSPAGV